MNEEGKSPPGTANLPIGRLEESGKAGTVTGNATLFGGMKKEANREIGGPGRTEDGHRLWNTAIGDRPR
jgi:hypothetical protein